MMELLLPNKAIFSKLGIFILLAALTFTGCDTVSESGNRGQVTLQFQTVTPSTNSAAVLADTPVQISDTLKIEGINGTLVITDIHFIVDDFELERGDGECEGSKGTKEDDCEEFESELIFVDLPLNGDSLKLKTAPVKKGMYNELEFEIDDLDLDEPEDTVEQQQKEAFLTKIRTEFGYKKWPESANMAVSGTFKPKRGKPLKFFTYAEAEISIEMEITPPLEVGNNAANKHLSVKINPAKWFTRPDGTVIGLVLYNNDYPATDEILEFESEMKKGFESTEVEED